MTAPPPRHEDGRTIHRRETRWQIWLPFSLVALLMLGLFLVLFLPQDANAGYRAEAVANVFVTLFVLCPGVVVLFGLYILVVACVAGVAKLHDKALPPLQRLEQLAASARTRVSTWTTRANHSGVRFGALLAPLETMFHELEKFAKETRDDTAGR